MDHFHKSPHYLAIARILKVNHAGEYGAIRIYRTQLFFARILYPGLVTFLEETLGHEIEHCRMFMEEMKKRNTRPCYVMSLWGNGGWILGTVTALMGAQSIWICTAAVESAVHRHLNDQLHFLKNKDPNLYATILSIQDEELAHLNHAQMHIETETFHSRLLHQLVGKITDLLIWLSTWGASSRMALELANAMRTNEPG